MTRPGTRTLVDDLRREAGKYHCREGVSHPHPPAFVVANDPLPIDDRAATRGRSAWNAAMRVPV
jgi:hypothetical protein